jgi:hypothetical protein
MYVLLCIGLFSITYLHGMHNDSGDYLSIQKRIEELRQELIQLDEFDISNQQKDVHETQILDEIYKLNQEIQLSQKLKEQQEKTIQDDLVDFSDDFIPKI